MAEGTLLSWRVAVGDSVAEGDTVAEVSTDKVDFEVPAPVAGTVAELPWSEGDVVPVGDVFVVFDAAVAAPDDDGPSREAQDSVSRGPAAAPSAAGIVASPVLRRRAAEHGVDLSELEGSGPGGRILESDLDSAIAARSTPEPAGISTSPGAGFRREAVTGVRAIAAQRMAESARTAATSTTTFRIRADGLLARIQRIESSPESEGIKVTPLAVIARAIAVAASRHPRLNALVEEEGASLRIFDAVHLSVAMATSDGLVVPVIRNAEGASVLEIARSLSDLAARARSGDLTPSDVTGGTFTLSSTGGLEKADIVSTSPIINPPQTATMWVSRISDQPRVEAGSLTVGPMMTASLSFDHRFVDGADATAFINEATTALEDTKDSD